MTPDLWLDAHAYLRPLADLSTEVDRALAEIEVPDARIPDWEDYRADFLAGVPLLPSAAAGVNLERAGERPKRFSNGSPPERRREASRRTPARS